MNRELLQQTVEALELSSALPGHEAKWSDAINAIYAAIQQQPRLNPPAGWRFNVRRDDERVWLEVVTPDGTSAALSTRRTVDEGRMGTIAAQVLDSLEAALQQQPEPVAQAPTDWLLYEHSDGRRAVVPSAHAATFAAGDPSWYRAGVVTVHGVKGLDHG